MTPFSGAKLALVLDRQVVVLLRDNTHGLPFADMWDFPGGGREGAETPEQTVLRETSEEIGLTLSPDRLVFKSAHVSTGPSPARVWFFGAHLAQDEAERMRLGDEGQDLRLMPVRTFLEHPRAIPSLQARLELFLTYLEMS